MQIKKNLTKIKECPICKNRKFINHGKTDNTHKDLKNLNSLESCAKTPTENNPKLAKKPNLIIVFIVSLLIDDCK